MAIGTIFNGQRLIRPQAASKIDDSAMFGRGLGGGNTLAIIGESTGGEPQKVQYFTDPSYAKAIFRSGPLLQAIQRAYDPSAAVSGAYTVAAIRVNQALQATLTMTDAYLNSLILLTSVDYGVWNNQLKVRFEDGTVVGSRATKKFTIAYGTAYEQGDKIYKNSIQLACSNPLATSATVTISKATGFLTTAVTATAQKIYYPDGSTPLSPITGVIDFNPITKYLYIGSDIPFGIINVTMGTVNSTNAATATAKYWNGAAWVDTSADFSRVIDTGHPFGKDGYIEFSIPGAWAKTAAADGAPAFNLYWIRIEMSAELKSDTAMSALTLSTGLSIQLSVYPTIQQLSAYIDDQPGYECIPVTNSPSSDLSTDLDDIFPATSFFGIQTTLSGQSDTTLTVVDSAGFIIGDYIAIAEPTGGLFEELKRVTGVAVGALTIDSVLSRTYSVSSIVRKAYALSSDLQAVIDWINSNSSYITAAYNSTTSRAALVNIPNTYLTGGSEGTSNQEDWDNAIALLQTEDTALVTCAVCDPAVWASLSAHVSYMSGIGKKERIGFVGGFDANGGYTNGLGRWNSVPNINDSISSMLRYASQLNSDRMVYVGPGFKAYDENGALTTYSGAISAALVAGMAAGVDVATALTHNTIKAIGLEYNFKWADLDRLLLGGVCPLEYEPSVGYRVCQSITTWLENDKYDRRELSVRRTADYVARQVRDRLEADFVGQKGTATTLISIKNATISVLQQMYRAELLAGDAQNPPYKNIQCRLEGDICWVDFEASPVIPINYIPITIHLTVFTTTLTA